MTLSRGCLGINHRIQRRYIARIETAAQTGGPTTHTPLGTLRSWSMMRSRPSGVGREGGRWKGRTKARFERGANPPKAPADWGVRASKNNGVAPATCRSTPPHNLLAMCCRHRCRPDFEGGEESRGWSGYRLHAVCAHRHDRTFEVVPWLNSW